VCPNLIFDPKLPRMVPPTVPESQARKTFDFCDCLVPGAAARRAHGRGLPDLPSEMRGPRSGFCF
jgi:hypothetical protein